MTRRHLSGLTVASLIASVLFVGTNHSSAQESLDVSQAISRALARNRELARSALSTESSEFRLADARTPFQVRFRPDVTAGFSGGEGSVGYGFLASKKLGWGTQLVLSGRVSENTNAEALLGAPVVGEPHEGRIRVEIQQPIFRNFGPLIHGEAIVQAGNDLKGARRTFELQKADLVVNVVRTFENILRLEQQVRSDRGSFKRMDDLYRVTRAKEVLARTTRIDTLRVELLRGEASRRLEASRERLDFTRRDFAELLGSSPDTVFELERPRALEFEVPSPEEAVKTALKNRLDYALVLQGVEDASRGVRIANRRLLPDLNLIAGHEQLGAGPNASDALRFDDKIWFVGLSVGTDLNRARERIALGRATTDQKAALQTVEITRLSIARQVQQHLSAYRRAQTELKIAERNFELATARTKVARRYFELGRSDNFSVTDAEVAFLQAENQSLAARAEASVSGYRLARVLGTLIETPEELKPHASSWGP